MSDILSNFLSVDIRVARIVEVEEFPEARKPAWKLMLDAGECGELRTSAQITNYSREELLGRKVIAAVNLGSRQIANFMSNCLVLAAVNDEGVAHLLGVDDAAEPGERVS